MNLNIYTVAKYDIYIILKNNFTNESIIICNLFIINISNKRIYKNYIKEVTDFTIYVRGKKSNKVKTNFIEQENRNLLLRLINNLKKPNKNILNKVFKETDFIKMSRLSDLCNYKKSELNKLGINFIFIKSKYEMILHFDFESTYKKKPSLNGYVISPYFVYDKLERKFLYKQNKGNSSLSKLLYELNNPNLFKRLNIKQKNMIIYLISFAFNLRKKLKISEEFISKESLLKPKSSKYRKK